jgi:flagellar biosynthesis protein FlhB
MNEVTVGPTIDFFLKMNSSIDYQSTLANQLLRQPTRQATLIGAILAFVFIFFGLIGNLLLITTILSVKKLRMNIINIFIVSVRENPIHTYTDAQLPFILLLSQADALA